MDRESGIKTIFPFVWITGYIPPFILYFRGLITPNFCVISNYFSDISKFFLIDQDIFSVCFV